MTLTSPAKSLAAAISFMTATLIAGGVIAQPVRPNILIYFDSSGSMLAEDTYDGTLLCGDQGKDSRIYVLKEALREALVQVGTDEANFGLARFPQKEDPTQEPVCPYGHYYVDSSSQVPFVKKDQTVDYRGGCKLSTHDVSKTSEAAYGSWFDDVYREALLVPVTKAAGSWTNPGPGDFDPEGANLKALYKWIDLVEDTDRVAPIVEPELRTKGGGLAGFYTPLGRSLYYARLYFDNYVKPRDPRAACRQNVVILVTDGNESCDEGTISGLDLATCNVASTPSRYHPEIQSCKLLRNSNVRTYVLTERSLCLTNGVPDLNKQPHKIAKAGGTNEAICVTLTNKDEIKSALIGIIAETIPPIETCNAADDDCDGQVDEAPLPGVGDQCGCPGLLDSHIGKGACKKGALMCVAGGLTCAGCVSPTIEVCNGLDDDCDGDVDEDFKVPGRDLGKSCDNGLRGVCYRSGNIVCTPDGTGTFCDAPKDVKGTAEVCNGLDDNCDGRTDEGTLPGTGEPCGADLGVCRAGTIRCLGGKFVCEGADVPGSKEICNAKDDDCNGIVDESVSGVGEVCACPPYPLSMLTTGECKPGKRVCKGREPLDCEGCILPRPEICDGLDNNCDGKTDENNPCTVGRVCVGGRCQVLCKQDEFPCPNGYNCNRTTSPPVCESTKCTNVLCAPGSECDPGSGLCKDLCEGLQCAAPKICRAGRCEDCYTLGCASGELCIDGSCQANPCANKNCGEGKYCDEQGTCVAFCQPSCSGDERCVRGACQKDPCAATSAPLCGQSEVCDPADGQCKPNLCKLTGRTCPGQACVPVTGLCKDNPCATVVCGPCSRCEMAADGLPLCAAVSAAECEVKETRIQVKGGGCSCSTGAAESPIGGLSVALLLGSTILSFRRRRHRRR